MTSDASSRLFLFASIALTDRHGGIALRQRARRSV
jgi:hypothetical protein